MLHECCNLLEMKNTTGKYSKLAQFNVLGHL